jgi:hypothetical protein
MAWLAKFLLDVRDVHEIREEIAAIDDASANARKREGGNRERDE